MLKDIIKEKVSVLNPNFIEVIDNSSAHAGHSGNSGGGNFHLNIVSEEFKDLSLIKRHQKIFALLQQEFDSNLIHALSIDAKSPDEVQ